MSIVLERSCDIDDDIISVAISSPRSTELDCIENQLAHTIKRQTRIAASKGMSLDEYLEDLADRREEIREAIIAKRMHKLYDVEFLVG